MVQSITTINSPSKHEIFSNVCHLAKWKTLCCYWSQKLGVEWLHPSLWDTHQIWQYAPFWSNITTSSSRKPWSASHPLKSNVASAFLNLPAHPIWQLQQIVTIDKHLYIVQRLVFGNQASPCCWCAVSSLIFWLAIYKFNVDGLHVYMDDFFRWDYDNNLVFDYGHLCPYCQVQLLLLWEYISCPFEDKKQDHGEVLKIIGFFVDINRGTITLTPESIDNVISKIHIFLATLDWQPHLCDWQCLGRHLNWVLNVLPWGRPALSELYWKTSGKTQNPPIFINSTIHSDLPWLADTILKAIGVHFVDSGVWDDSLADLTIWTDANLSDAFTKWVGKLKNCTWGSNFF